MFGKKRIYLDYASATPLCREAEKAMLDAARFAGNPGAIHAEGVAAAQALGTSRERIARTVGCKARELIFTSGATEANNLALVGLARRLEQVKRGISGTHWLISSIEHPSVLSAAGEVERLGGSVSYIEPDERGIVPAEKVVKELRKETVCVSIGWANSEIGVVQPLAQIARAVRAYEKEHKTKIIFHSDAGQAPLYLATTVHSLGVDLFTLDSAKLYGPHGLGVLYVRNTAELAPILWGGSQERGLRPGTENVMLAAGFAAALERLERIREKEAERVNVLRDTLAQSLTAALPGMILNGDLAHSLPHMLNISLPSIQSEYVTLALDHAGIAVSTKSACREGEEQESHVVKALGGPEWRARNTLRFSLGEETSASDSKRVVDTLMNILSTRN